MKKITVLALVAIILAGALCGTVSMKKEKNKLIYPSIMLNAFDDYDDLHLTTYNWLLGEMDINNDSTYVKDGNGSLKVVVDFDPYTPNNASVSFTQSTTIHATGEDYSDFSYTGAMTFDIFNAQPKVRKVGIQLKYPGYDEATEWLEIQPLTWTAVKYSVSREFIPQVEEKGQKVSKVNSIGVFFERPTEADDVFYLDNFRLYKTEEKMDSVIMKLEEDEICSFDKYWQFQKVRKNCLGAALLSPTAKWVMFPDETERGGIMEVNTVPVPNASYIGYWPSVDIGEEFTGQLNLASYTAEDCFCLDVYKPENGVDRLYMEVYAMNERITTKVLDLQPQWNEFRFTVTEMNTDVDGHIAELDGEYSFRNVDLIKITYAAALGESKTYYLDNIRMERVAERGAV